MSSNLGEKVNEAPKHSNSILFVVVKKELWTGVEYIYNSIENYIPVRVMWLVGVYLELGRLYIYPRYNSTQRKEGEKKENNRKDIL